MAAASGWIAIGAPLDSAGEGEGEERAPAALREAGLLEALGASDRGDIETTIASSVRDPETGVIGYRQVLTASAEIRDAVAAACADGGRPLVLGGDCTLLIGALAGARRALGEPLGLAMVDAHLDFYDGSSSPTGECADMDLAILCGRGPEELAEIAGAAPIVRPEHAVALGFREPRPGSVPDDEAFVPEADLVDPAVEVVEAGRIADPAELGARVEALLAASPGRFWLHLDADALDPEVMPAVSYPEPGGLDWEAALELLRPLGGSDALIGASVADLNTDRDPDGSHARRLAELVAAALGPA